MSLASLVVWSVTGVFLLSCASTYGPACGGAGYSDVALGKDRYQVSFLGTEGMSETRTRLLGTMACIGALSFGGLRGMDD